MAKSKTVPSRVTRVTKPTATSIKNLVWETIQGLKDGSSDPKIANAISSGCRTILSTEKLVLQVAKLANKKPTANTQKFING